MAFHRWDHATRDFPFYVEKVDSSGEDGNFKERSHRIE
jgi:hypothetical protein